MKSTPHDRRTGAFPSRRFDRVHDQPLRIALYSHDAMGVGHVRRNLLIAQALSEDPVNATSLVICGVHEASVFQGGTGIDCLIVPTIEKRGNDDYRPRDLRLSRDVVSRMRSKIIDGALQAFDPDILIVDKVPCGLCGELENILPVVKNRDHTRIVFGMREVLDMPESVAEEWQRHGYEDFVREHYDAIWVYGDQAIFDPIAEYGLESLRERVRFTGYFDQRERLRFADPDDAPTRLRRGSDEKLLLCMVGGGQDGFQLAQAFAQAKLPPRCRGVIVTGPLMPRDQQHVIGQLAAQQPAMEVLCSVAEANWLVRYADRVVCMGGYNNVLSVVSFGHPALIVPRVLPRREQWLRARVFEKRGLVDVLEPDSLTPAAISDWLARPIPSQVAAQRFPVDLNGLKRLPDLVADLLTGRAGPIQRPSPARIGNVSSTRALPETIR